jgi:threonine dehydratase
VSGFRVAIYVHGVLAPPSLDEIRAARDRIAGIAIETPLVRVPMDIAPDAYLKLENLQPIGSFKIRGAASVMSLAAPALLGSGVYTASAGNMAQGVAWCARTLGVKCSVVVPDHAPKTKTDAIERLGGTVIRVPFDAWWQTLIEHEYHGLKGLFVHPFADPFVMAGNGTIALEIFEQLDEVDAILVPYGGGGLSCGIAAATRALSPRTKVYAVEAATAAPLTASLAAGKPVTVEMTRTWIDGMGSNAVSAEMWPIVTELLAGTKVVSVDQVADALRTLVNRVRVVAEGAGAAGLAVIAAHPGEWPRVVSIVSGGNIDLTRLVGILQPA